MTRASNESEDDLRQIGDVADAVGLSIRTIRYYEEVGLAPPSGRSTGGFRLYTDDDVARLRLVKSFKPLDFTLEELCDLLGLRDRLDAGDALTDDDVDRLVAYAHAAARRSEGLREQLQSIESVARLLTRQADRARREARRVAR